MTELSPAAQTVLDAFNGFHDLVNRRLKIAAALEAVADQVMPHPIRLPRNSYAEGAYDKRLSDRRSILAIAAELRGDTTTTETP